MPSGVGECLLGYVDTSAILRIGGNGYIDFFAGPKRSILVASVAVRLAGPGAYRSP